MFETLKAKKNRIEIGFRKIDISKKDNTGSKIQLSDSESEEDSLDQLKTKPKFCRDQPKTSN